MSLESGNKNINNIENNNAENFSQINKILGRDCKKFIEEIPKEKQKDVKKALGIEDINNINPILVRKNFQEFQRLRNTGKDTNEILYFSKCDKAKYINEHTKILNIQEQQKTNIESRLNKLGIGNTSALLEILENEDNKDFGFLLLDTLIFIKEDNGDVFNGNIKLGNEGINALKTLYPDIDSKNITLNQLKLILTDEHKGIAKPLIENELNEKFLSTLDKSLRSSNNIEDSKKAVNNIINSDSLKFFVEYYNYKNPGKALDIDLSQPITPENKKKLEKAIQEELYQNGFITDLTDEEKTQLDIETNNKINYARRNRERFREFTRLRKKGLDPDSGISLAITNGIGERLLEKFNQKTDKINKDHPRVLNYARRNFCKDKDIPLIPLHLLKALYKETNEFSNFDGNGENLKKFRKYFGENELQFNDVCSQLKSGFYSYLSEAQGRLSRYFSRMEEKKDIAKNNLAIGSVIDGIRKIFTDFGETDNINGHIHNLELDKAKPVELENNNEGLIINGTFKGNTVKIKYDLDTGKIYINSCITKKYPGTTIIFGETYPNLYVGKIEDFASKLENYKIKNNETNESPQNTGDIRKDKIESRLEQKKQNVEEVKESFKNQIKETGEKIGAQLKLNQAKNETTTNFLKTLGIIDSSPHKIDKTIQFEEGSDTYKVLEIINNSEESAIQTFSEKIKTLAEFAGRSRGNNKPHENRTTYEKLIGEVADGIMHMNDKEKLKYKDTLYFLEKITNLTDNDFEFTGEGVIGKEYKNPFATIIYEKFSSKETPKKLDSQEIEKFVKEISDDKDLIISLSNLKG